ncbi:uroporphyrinogen-III C-methyltransferase [Kaarinaea lacus]
MSDEKQNTETDDSKEKGMNMQDNAAISGENKDKSQDLAKNSTDSRASESKSDKTKKPRKKITFSWVFSFAALLIVGLGAGNYWQYQQGQQLSQLLEQMGQRQSELDQQLNIVDKQVNEIQNQQESIATKVGQNENGQRSVIASLDQMSQQLKSLSTAKGKEPLFWRVSEVEYLLSVANIRLVLERDVLTAKTALADADKRLRVIGDPGLIPVREKISNEINQLNNVSLPDVPGLAAQISSIIDEVGQLPFVKKSVSLEPMPAEESDKEFSGVGNLAKTVWSDLVDGLFKVQRSDEPIEPLLPPEEKHYLVHNLRLKLEQARFSLLKNETELFRKNLVDVEQWVQNYFDQQDASVSHLLQTVQELKQVELQPTLPDISASLREIRSWIEIQQQNVASRHPSKASSQLAHSARGAGIP